MGTAGSSRCAETTPECRPIPNAIGTNATKRQVSPKLLGRLSDIFHPLVVIGRACQAACCPTCLALRMVTRRIAFGSRLIVR